MKWRTWIQDSYAARKHKARADLCAGASAERLMRLEAVVGCGIPIHLRELLAETDGARGSLFLGDEWMETETAIWSCDEIAERNLAERANPEGALPPPGAPDVTPLFFAPAGVDGIVFAFLVGPQGPDDPAVYAFYPMEREWRRISPSLDVHLRGWTV